MGGATALSAATPVFIRRLVDDVMIGRNLGILAGLLFSLLGCFILRGLLDYGQEYFSDIAGWKVIQDARIELFGHILREDQTFFRDNTPGELMSRVKSDTETVGEALGFVGIFMVQILVHVVTMMACLLRQSASMALVCVVVMPFIGYIGWKGESQGDAIYGDISEENAKMNKTAGEAISGIRTVKAYHREEYEKRRFEKRNKHFFDLSVRLEWIYGKFDSLSGFLGRLILFGAILVGGLQVIGGRMSPGVLASSVEYVNSLIWPMMEIGWVLNNISAASASSKKIDAIFKRESRLREGTVEKIEDPDLEFSHVGLVYEDGARVLDDISFSLPPGKTLGIMGATGSGKSTVTNLALRFVEPTEGTITLGGRPLGDYTSGALRRAYAIVTQDIFLFSETVKDNISIGSPLMGEETIVRSAVQARADGFVRRLEDGYDTVIGEKGVGLSGGQKQRLCIARALAKGAPILILDDATSALDMETERMIQRDLEKIEGRRSAIIVAHRISAVRRADEIVYLEKGRIVERGTHKELMALRGRYYETYVAQYSKEDADADK